ncbi:MAG TPA: hypothetical protein DCP90_01720 [Clostridiales bacterium]|nr:MAG: hypothetical protein A2Y22_03470 [Clostridiales bacterium GWD2_32_59]HAN09312.1 hypothetical protein [Clostridiales bacterium]
MKKWMVLLTVIIIITVFFAIGYTREGDKKQSALLNNNKPITKDVLIDKGYLLALNSVDQFLGAWLMRDEKKGLEFITKRLKDSLTANESFAFFVGTSNPHHQGFEVTGSERVDESTIRFNVWLYEDITGESPTPKKRGKPMYVDVVKFNEYQWLVDSLPRE